MNNIVLIGMPGCGKSTIGVVLAKVMGYRFIDSDLLIQERENRLLKDIINEDVSKFIQIENEINSEIRVEKAVIATGGSVVYCKEAMEHLRAMGTVIYIKLPYEEIKLRVGDLAERGIAMKKGQTLKDIYVERSPLYEKFAHFEVDISGKTIKEAMTSVKEKYEWYLKN